MASDAEMTRDEDGETGFFFCVVVPAGREAMRTEGRQERRKRWTETRWINRERDEDGKVRSGAADISDFGVLNPGRRRGTKTRLGPWYDADDGTGGPCSWPPDEVGSR